MADQLVLDSGVEPLLLCYAVETMTESVTDLTDEQKAGGYAPKSRVSWNQFAPRVRI